MSLTLWLFSDSLLDAATISKRSLPQIKNFPAGSPNIKRIQQAYRDMDTIVNFIFQNIGSDGQRAQRVYLKYFDMAHNQRVADVLRAM